MSFDESPLGFFPTPYPDEIFYSVLCRYHIRSGNPAFVSTAKTIWGKKISANLYLPQSLSKVALRIPPQTGLTAECFAINNTIYPFLKPFLPEERGLQVLELLKSEAQSEIMAYQLCGLPRSKSPKWQYLRYCEDCWQEDIQLYGEPYWHRLHLLPGVLMCPVHGKPIKNSLVFQKDISSKFHAASFAVASNESAPSFCDGAAEKLMNIAVDAAWIMQNGNALPFSESTMEIYDRLLQVKGYRCLSGRRMKSQLLDKEICEFYGQELLELLEVRSQGVVPWSERIMHKRNSLLYPVYYLLLMRFLAGSAKDFFTKQHDVAHPYGAGPWPCRNPVCPYYLKDVISELPPLVQFASRHQTTFTCPHCGFAYRRSRERPKSKQYFGQINTVDYGWLWMDTFKEMMKSGAPIMHITEKLHCGYLTVKRLGVELGFLPADQLPKKKPHIYYERKTVPEPALKPTSTDYYRAQWLQVVKDNPDSSRSFLIKRYSEIYKWLRENDVDWYEANAPKSKRYTVFEWADSDDDSLKKARAAVAYLKSLPGRPVWINRHSVEKYGGLNNLYKNLAKGYLSKTQAYLDEALETDGEWRKRKIQWAVKELYDAGKNLLLPQIQIKASISHKLFTPLETFTRDCIEQLQK